MVEVQTGGEEGSGDDNGGGGAIAGGAELELSEKGEDDGRVPIRARV